jgi:CMP-N,N'-diacetyllegionaminic acid synthase
MAIICTICARRGSKGVPGKNSRSLLGKPLIAYSIEQALQTGIFDQVYVSTDCSEIAKIAQEFGAVVPFMRPPELANDEAPKIPVIQHLVDFIESQGNIVDTIIDLDPTSPLREIEDIKKVCSLLKDDIEVVITGYLSNKNPYFNMVEYNEKGFVELSKSSSKLYASRQTSPPVYGMNGSIYAWKRNTLGKGIWDNKKIAFYEMPLERSVDIDSYVDWKLVELLMAERK